MNDAQRKGRRTLVLIALMFALPIALAMYMYYSGSSLGPMSGTQNGELVLPPRMLPDEALTDDSEQRLRKIWSLVVLTDESCDAVCAEALVHIRQVRLSLGPKMTRMQTVALPASATAISPELLALHPKLIVADPEKTQATRTGIGGYSNGQIFLVDPLGNLMMSYAPGMDMGDIRKDLAHLFKLSGIG